MEIGFPHFMILLYFWLLVFEQSVVTLFRGQEAEKGVVLGKRVYMENQDLKFKILIEHIMEMSKRQFWEFEVQIRGQAWRCKYGRHWLIDLKSWNYISYLGRRYPGTHQHLKEERKIGKHQMRLKKRKVEEIQGNVLEIITEKPIVECSFDS